MVWRHLLASDPALVPSSARSANYDPDNGQVFTETTFSMPASMLSSWTTTTIGSVYDVTNFKNRESPGADALEQMALRSILANLNDLDVETLSCVPWTVGRKIWQYIMRVCVFHTHSPFLPSFLKHALIRYSWPLPSLLYGLNQFPSRRSQNQI